MTGFFFIEYTKIMYYWSFNLIKILKQGEARALIHFKCSTKVQLGSLILEHPNIKYS